ncbi:MAG: CoA transferase [Hyphomicrobiales bacterium]|nr:MAG: CoA transferase [Hyphomicrobiales bacterium]
MKPLSDMRVISFEQYGAGPYGTMFLAELGADVLKVEQADVGGDPARHVGPHMLGPGDSQYFQAWNLGKRSITLDIKSEAGRKDFHRLVRGADAVVNNMRGSLPKTLGLDYAALKSINPAIVCLHISAYGRDNERANWPGYDYLMQAEAGLMSLTGEPEAPPARVGASMIDTMTGMTGTVGLLSAILQARRTGLGCDVDTCLFDVALHQLTYSALWYLNSADKPGRQSRSAHLSQVPVQTYPTSDGWIFIMCMTEKFWRILCDEIGRPDLYANAAFATAAARRANKANLNAIIDQELRKKPTAFWLARLTSKIPIAPVFDVDQALDAPFTHQTGMVSSVPHPNCGSLKVLANPIKIDGKRMSQKACSALGADNAVIEEERAKA